MMISHERGQGLMTAQGRPFRDFLRSAIAGLRRQLITGRSQNTPAIQSAPTTGQAMPHGQSTQTQPATQSSQTGLINYKLNIPLGCLLNDKELEDLFPGRFKNSFRNR